jgi:hypothetical protein
MPERTDRSDSMILAAALSGISVDFVDTIRGEDIPEKVLPPEGADPRTFLSDALISSWRGHMNALKESVFCLYWIL